MAALRRFKPLFDRVLIQKAAAETKTKSGILIPEKAQGKVLEGVVVSVGPGLRKENGEIVPVCVKEGDKVILPEYGGTKLTFEEQDYFLYRDGDFLGKFDS